MGAKSTFGLIIGNRGFFPDHLAKSGREEMIQVLNSAGIEVVVLGPEQSKQGAVETHEEAKRCAALFRAASDHIDGVIVSLPNFGRRARDCRHPAIGEAECAGTHPGYARPHLQRWALRTVGIAFAEKCPHATI